MTEKITLSKNSKNDISISKALIAQWKRLYTDPERKYAGDAGARAALRRALTPEAVLMEPAFHTMLHAIQASGVYLENNNMQFMQIALIAGVLAERRDTQQGSVTFMQALGGSPVDVERKLSSFRFQSVISALDKGTDEEKMRTLRRAMKMADDKLFDHQAFAYDILNWSSRTRIKWTFNYFGRNHQSEPSVLHAQSTDAEELP